jgi:electron transport complex protein RnfB
MHAVIAADCTGCELCLPPCPVDCIALVPAPGLPSLPLGSAAIEMRAVRFRSLQEARNLRLSRNRQRWRTALDQRLDAAPGPGGTARP